MKCPILRARAMLTIRTWMKSMSMLTTQLHAQVHAQFVIGMTSTDLVGGETHANSAINALGCVESEGASDSQGAG